MASRSSKIYNLDEAREKIRAFCAYRERSQLEVREKLLSYGLIPDVVDELLSELIQENFLNEERFARAFVRGKFNIKKWGRIKIRQALRRHNLSAYVMDKAISEIDPGKYDAVIEELLKKKKKLLKEKNTFKRNGMLARWLISRGFEPDIVWEKVC